jgi:hypothetical protein
MTRAQGRLAFNSVVTGCTDKALLGHILNPASLARSYAGMTMETVREALEAERDRRAAR